MNEMEKLQDLINEVQRNEIMLPDFQRPFTWEIEKQRKFIASVLTRLPVGGILLLKAKSDSYQPKVLGMRSDFVSSKQIPVPEEAYFLIDGQQRITCLVNVFSDIIHNNAETTSNLSSRALLAVRFFLSVPRWNKELKDTNDIFGVGTLDLKIESRGNGLPKFLTDDIIDKIVVEKFQQGDNPKKPYAPSECLKLDRHPNLDDFCKKEDDWLIPLFLMIPTSDEDETLRSDRFDTILESYGADVKAAIRNYYNSIDDSEKNAFAHSILIEAADKDKYDQSTNKIKTFEEILDRKEKRWRQAFNNYLFGCIKELDLFQKRLEANQRERAIDIYENMNMGGVSLNTFDLVSAKVAKVSKVSFHKRVLDTLVNNHLYNKQIVYDKIKSYIDDTYNASLRTGACSKDNLTSIYTNLFLQILVGYSKNPDYALNLIKADNFKAARALDLKAEEIDKNCDRVCKALDRAMFFLQVKCGVRKLSELNNKLMATLIAYIFTNDDWFNDDNIIKKLEAWYWSALFSGEYDKDQYGRFERNLCSFVDSITTNDFSWIGLLRDRVLAENNVCDKDLILMKKVSQDRKPKENIGTSICQFFLAKGYDDLVKTKKGNGNNNLEIKKINVFCDYKLEKHHIVPLGSVAKISESTEELRKKDDHICNSPLNYVYISDSANKSILDKSLNDYENAIENTAKTQLHISNYPDENDIKQEQKVLKWLDERYRFIEGEIRAKINELLN